MHVRLFEQADNFVRYVAWILIAAVSAPAFAQDKFQFPLLVEDGYNGTLMPKEDFGSRQIAQMLDDRPDMKGVVKEGSRIWQFVREGFNSGDSGKRIYWLDGDFPEKNAFHHATGSHSPAYIHVPGDDYISPIDRWAMLVFEMFNIRNTPEFGQLYQRAIEFEISPQQFADEMLRLEFRAMRVTQSFFKDQEIEGASARVDHIYWRTRHGDLTDFDGYLASQNDNNPHRPRNMYKEYVMKLLEQKLDSLIKIAP